MRRHLRIRAVPRMAIWWYIRQASSITTAGLASTSMMSLRRHIVGTYIDPESRREVLSHSSSLTHNPPWQILSLIHPPKFTMTSLNGSQNDKKNASATVSMDTGTLVPPQEEKSTPKQPAKRDLSWLLPPQEEMIDVARARGEKGESVRFIVYGRLKG